MNLRQTNKKKKSCQLCIHRKRRCDGGEPCAFCVKLNIKCERVCRLKTGPTKGSKYKKRPSNDTSVRVGLHSNPTSRGEWHTARSAATLQAEQPVEHIKPGQNAGWAADLTPSQFAACHTTARQPHLARVPDDTPYNSCHLQMPYALCQLLDSGVDQASSGTSPPTPSTEIEFFPHDQPMGQVMYQNWPACPAGAVDILKRHGSVTIVHVIESSPGLPPASATPTPTGFTVRDDKPQQWAWSAAAHHQTAPPRVVSPSHQNTSLANLTSTPAPLHQPSRARYHPQPLSASQSVDYRRPPALTGDAASERPPAICSLRDGAVPVQHHSDKCLSLLYACYATPDKEPHPPPCRCLSAPPAVQCAPPAVPYACCPQHPAGAAAWRRAPSPVPLSPLKHKIVEDAWQQSYCHTGASQSNPLAPLLRTMEPRVDVVPSIDCLQPGYRAALFW